MDELGYAKWIDGSVVIANRKKKMRRVIHYEKLHLLRRAINKELKIKQKEDCLIK